MSNEIDYLLTPDASGVRTYNHDDGSALEHRLKEWLDTPMGDVWGDPYFGHRLGQFKHQAQGSDLEVAIELSIVSKLPKDINIMPSYVRAEFISVDLVSVTIGIKNIEIESEVTL